MTAINETEALLEEKLRKKQEEEEIMWQDYAEQRRKQRQKEEEDLKRLKEKRAKRKDQRDTEDAKFQEIRKRENEARQKEMEAKRANEAEAKARRLEEAEKKRQAMAAAKEKRAQEPVKPNFVINKRELEDIESALGGTGFDKFANIMRAHGDMGKTKEQLEEDKRQIMSMRVKPLELEGKAVQDLKAECVKMWERYVQLISEKYDLEQRKGRQEYDMKSLAERERQINRSRALKKGLDPEALQGPHPPKIQVASKYERRTDRRTFGDKKGLFSGGFEEMQDLEQEKEWDKKLNDWKEIAGEKKLPAWDPENPKNKEVMRRDVLDDDDDDLEPPVFQKPSPSPPKQAAPPARSPPKAVSPPKKQQSPEKEEEEEEEEEESEEEESEEEEEEEE